MAGHKKWRTLLKDKTPDQVHRIEEGARALQSEILLAELRKIGDVTQVELAERLGVSQANVSQIENQDDIQISTLYRLVNALGGSIRITVQLPAGEYTIGQFRPANTTATK